MKTVVHVPKLNPNIVTFKISLLNIIKSRRTKKKEGNESSISETYKLPYGPT